MGCVIGRVAVIDTALPIRGMGTGKGVASGICAVGIGNIEQVWIRDDPTVENVGQRAMAAQALPLVGFGGRTMLVRI